MYRKPRRILLKFGSGILTRPRANALDDKQFAVSLPMWRNSFVTDANASSSPAVRSQPECVLSG